MQTDCNISPASLVEDEERDFFKAHMVKAEARLREGGGLSLLSLSREKLGAGERGGPQDCKIFCSKLDKDKDKSRTAPLSLSLF